MRFIPEVLKLLLPETVRGPNEVVKAFLSFDDGARMCGFVRDTDRGRLPSRSVETENERQKHVGLHSVALRLAGEVDSLPLSPVVCPHEQHTLVNPKAVILWSQ